MMMTTTMMMMWRRSRRKRRMRIKLTMAIGENLHTSVKFTHTNVSEV
jgi:hypothetical protein